MDLNRDYIITRESRTLLSKPMGMLLQGTIEENIRKAPQCLNDNYPFPKKEYEVICVGDVVSEAFLKSNELNQHLKICVVDGQTKRQTYHLEGGKILPNKITIVNKPGSICSSATHTLKNLVMNDKKYLVMVEGEEDLLVIPLILLVKDYTYIIYGQPPITDLGENIPAGMVIISVTQQVREKVAEILKTFNIN